jgi:sugar phosphate permease
MKRIFYGWVITGCAFFALMVSNGLTFGGITVFDESMLAEFGWTRSTLKFRDLLTMTLAGALSPFAGALADRFGVKWLMVFGGALLAVALLLYGFIGSAGQMYAIHIAFAVTLATAGIVMGVILISRWFVKQRGTATGLALVGTSAGGALFPLIGAWLIPQVGWRTSLMILAAFPVALVFVVLALVRDRPASMGLEPLGAGTGPGGGAGGGASPAGGMEFREALRTPAFWLIAAAGMLTFYAILGTSGHVFLHLRGLGVPVQEAARGLSWLFVMGLAGKIAFGFLADRFDHKRVLLVDIGVMLAGSLALASMRPEAFWPFVILFGLGWGGIYTMLQLLTIDLFGLKAAGRILGTRTVLDALGGGLGPWLPGLLFDRTGGYQLPFVIITGCVVLTFAAAAALRVRPGGSVHAAA